MRLQHWLSSCLAIAFSACDGGNSRPAPAADPDVVAIAQFRTAAAGHRIAERKVDGLGGVDLATYVYLPPTGSGPFPVLVMRTPYDLPITPVGGFPEEHPNAGIEARPEDVGWSEATDRGYALVVQHLRGRYASDGVFSLFLDEREDGDALLRWIEKQPWCNGRIGIFGDSASGVASLQAAASGRPSVRAVFAQATSADFLGGVIFPEGRVKWDALLPFVLSQSFDNGEDHDAQLGLTPEQVGQLKQQAGQALGEMFDALEAGTPEASTWWTNPITPEFPLASQLQPRWSELINAGASATQRAALDVTDGITAPTLHVSLWHDFFQASAFRTFARLQAARGNQKLIVLDGTHYDIDDPELWPTQPMFPWFDHWLKDAANGVPAWPNVQYTVAGRPAAGLQTSPTWPPAGVVMQARPLAAPTGALTIQPAAPAPTLGGNHLTASSGMIDQRPLIGRSDVVELAGTAMAATTRITGSASATLQVLAAGVGDVVVKLVDRRGDGEVRLLREQPVALAGAGAVTVDFSGLAYEFDVGSAPGLLVVGTSVPGYVSRTAPLTGVVHLGTAELRLPLAP
jgi:putative CocE/NonD family hydrolase